MGNGKWLAGILLAALWATTAQAGDLHLSAATSLKNVLADIIAEFGKTRPDTAVRSNYGASGTLAKQIVQGAPADLFISADDRWLDYLIAEGKGVADSRQVLAANTLVFAGPPDTGVTSLGELSGLRRIAIGSPASVPAGRYAEQAMEKAGVYAELSRDSKLVMAQDVRQALLYADRGEVDGAFVYATDALLATRARVLFTVPENLHDPIVYPMIMTPAGAGRPEVRQFFAWLAGPQAKALLAQYGFTAR